MKGRAEAGHAKASPRVKYPKLAIKTRKKRRSLIFCGESANIWLSRGSVCLCALSPLCPPFYLSPVDKYGKAVRLLKPESTLVGRVCGFDVTVMSRVNAGHILFFLRLWRSNIHQHLSLCLVCFRSKITFNPNLISHPAKHKSTFDPRAQPQGVFGGTTFTF